MYATVSDPSVQADEGRHLTERGAFERQMYERLVEKEQDTFGWPG